MVISRNPDIISKILAHIRQNVVSMEVRPLNDEFAIVKDQMCAAFCGTSVYGPVKTQAPPILVH